MSRRCRTKAQVTSPAKPSTPVRFWAPPPTKVLVEALRAALRQIRREKTETVADSAQKARVGQLADLSDSQEYDDLMARERSVISGHTDVEFTGLLTVTTPTAEALDAAVATITRAAAQASCEVRPLYGRQMQGFIAAALPLGRTTF